MAFSFFPPYLLQFLTRLHLNSCSCAKLEITSSSKVSQCNCVLKREMLNKLIFSSRFFGYNLNYGSAQTQSSTLTNYF